MIAGDNTTVAALAAMARDARIATGHVEAEGVSLADGATAGVGDVVATRRNDRTIAVGERADAGGYVRNRDRWTVAARQADGSLDVAHLRTGAAATLPAAYVAAHVELGYALSAYGAQGMTVDEAHVLASPGDPAALLYVGLTRGRHANFAHMVLDDPAAEPGHMAAAQGGPVEALAAVLANEGPATATAVALDEAARENDPAVLAARYLAVADEDRRTRLTRAATAVGSNLLAGEDAWKVLDAAARVERAGRDPAPMIAELGPDATVNQAVSVLNHASIPTAGQLVARTYGEASRNEPLVAGILPPISAHADPTVVVWAATAADRLERLRAGLAADLATGEPPPWAAALGARPDAPALAGPWAAQAAHVALYRQTANIDSTDLLGPAPPPGSPLAAARHAADIAAHTARQISHPQPEQGQVSRSPNTDLNPRRPGPGHDYDYHRPHRGPDRGGPGFGM